MPKVTLYLFQQIPRSALSLTCSSEIILEKKIGRLQKDFLDIALLKLTVTPSAEANRQPEARQFAEGAPGTQGENKIMQQLTPIEYVIQLEFE